MREAIKPPSPVASAIASVAGRLSEVGIERPRAEAEALVRAVSGVSRESVLLHPDRRLSADQLSQLEALTARRAAREPLPYLLGEVEFYSLPFRVSPSAIVPRPETEILVEAAIERARAAGARRAIEVGTGCGAIAVALAQHLPQVRVTATDVSFPALLLARENCRRHKVGRRVSLICADLLAGVRGPADCILANLPYVRTDEFEQLEPEVRDFEPRAALDGGADGLGHIRRLCVQVFDHLADGGFAALEVGAGQASEAAKLLGAGRLSRIEVIADHAGIDRVVIGWRRE
ncbi:MAG: peptide chain release factor N(5)-glutamine methyltransferase [Armatimonadota bacterium]|nr:MAG: peptide chain release factor N(5)-glutamine methyltransferase [Armatimonadota bacterium]